MMAVAIERFDLSALTRTISKMKCKGVPIVCEISNPFGASTGSGPASPSIPVNAIEYARSVKSKEIGLLVKCLDTKHPDYKYWLGDEVEKALSKSKLLSDDDAQFVFEMMGLGARPRDAELKRWMKHKHRSGVELCIHAIRKLDIDPAFIDLIAESGIDPNQELRDKTFLLGGLLNRLQDEASIINSTRMPRVESIRKAVIALVEHGADPRRYNRVPNPQYKSFSEYANSLDAEYAERAGAKRGEALLGAILDTTAAKREILKVIGLVDLGEGLAPHGSGDGERDRPAPAISC
jgi:hypothetical protein